MIFIEHLDLLSDNRTFFLDCYGKIIVALVLVSLKSHQGLTNPLSSKRIHEIITPMCRALRLSL